MGDQLFSLRVFACVARTGSFSRAARELEIAQPTASRLIARLEEELGAILFSRSTRALTLTDAGAEYLARIQSVLDALDEANHEVRGTGDLRGDLRVGVASIFASRVIVPLLPRFMARHPALTVHLVIDDKRQDLIGERVDVALRFGKLTDSSAVARLIHRWPMIVAAAPGYLERHGTPTSPSDLASHSAIIAGPIASAEWTFTRGNEELSVRLGGKLRVTAGEVGINAGVAGLGIVAATYPSMQRELADGSLIRLLPDWSLGEIDAHAVFPGNQGAKPAARAFVEFLAQELRDF